MSTATVGTLQCQNDVSDGLDFWKSDTGIMVHIHRMLLWKISSAGLIASALPATSTSMASAAALMKIPDEGMARFGFILSHVPTNSWL